MTRDRLPIIPGAGPFYDIIRWSRNDISVCRVRAGFLIRVGAFFCLFVFFFFCFGTIYGSRKIKKRRCNSELHRRKRPICRVFRFFRFCQNCAASSSILLASTKETPDFRAFIVSRETIWYNVGSTAFFSKYRYCVIQRSNQNLIKIDYKFTPNTNATFYDIISGFSIIGFLGSNRK